MPKLLLMLKKNRKHAEEKLQNCTEPQKKWHRQSTLCEIIRMRTWKMTSLMKISLWTRHQVLSGSLI